MFLTEMDRVHYVVDSKGTRMGHFKLRKMPYCAAVYIICNLEVYEPYRGKGISKFMVSKAIEIAKDLKVKRLLATVVETNTPMLRTLKDWKVVDRFKNYHTGNVVLMLNFPIKLSLLKRVVEWLRT